MGGPASPSTTTSGSCSSARPAANRWKLVTPPGTADNGGLVLAAGGPEMITAFRPSQDLTYTPLTQTSDGGQGWSRPQPAGRAAGQHPERPRQPATGQRAPARTAH